MHFSRLGWTGAIAIAGSVLGASDAQAQTTLRLDNWLPAQHALLERCIMPWIEQVREATDGQVNIELTGASLGTPARQYDMVTQGIVDVVFGVHGYTPGRFAMPGIAELPFMGESGEARSIAYWEVHEEYLEEAGEHDDVALLALFAPGTGTIMTSTNPVRNLEDYAGLKFRVGGGIVQDINPLLGGVNVAAPAGEVYEMLSQGIVDGTLLPPETYTSFGLSDVIRYRTEVPGGLYSSSWFAAVNKDRFEALGEEDRAALASVSGGELARLCGRAFDEKDEAGREAMAADGVEVIVVDEAETAKIRDLLSGIEKDWLDAAAAKGVDAEAALDAFRRELAEAEKTAR